MDEIYCFFFSELKIIYHLTYFSLIIYFFQKKFILICYSLHYVSQLQFKFFHHPLIQNLCFNYFIYNSFLNDPLNFYFIIK